MDPKEFKKMFDFLAKKNGFLKKKSFWLKQFLTSIISIELQKSSFSNLYYINIKSCIQNVFNKQFSLNDNSVENYYGASCFRPPVKYEHIFNLGSTLTDEEREQELNNFFHDFLKNFIDEISTAEGILNYSETSGKYFVPEFKKELERIAVKYHQPIDPKSA